MIGFIRLEDGVLDTFAAICMAALFAEHSDQGLQFAAILPLQVSANVYHDVLSYLWNSLSCDVHCSDAVAAETL